MLERQNLEWKQRWDDEYLKWICGFANASGGVLEIGRNDKTGEIIGVDNPKKLLVDLPNKIRSATGVIPGVDLLESDGKPYIVITVKPYAFPVSCHGKYYIRSGSTNQEISGAALDEFILRVQGKTWDGVPVPYVSCDEFESDAFKVFRRKAIDSTRLSMQDLEITDEKLLDTLRLTEGKYLKRAALLLFHQDPEKWFSGAFVKIGMFENDADLLYQHEVHCPLIMMPDKVIEIVYLNYFKGIISYDGIQRIETYPVPHAAFREAITNAIVHRDYSTCIPIQIKVFPDRVIIYNDGRLPQGWTIDDLMKTHRSQPHNPLIAGAFFRSGQVESWGRGIEKITDACKSWGKPEPSIEFKHGCEFSITFYSDVNIITNDRIKDTISDRIKDTVTETQSRIMSLIAANPRITAQMLGKDLDINERNVRNNIKALKDAGLIERIGANKNGRWVVKRHE